MKQTVRILLLLIVLAGASSPTSADRGGYVIDSFDVELLVMPSSHLQVTETIVVEFSEPRHGIYRMIPVRYTDPRGYQYSLGFEAGAVSDERNERYGTKISNKGSYISIRIGSPQVQVDGRVVYVIRYRLNAALGHFPEHDELYWNVTGNEWNVPIRQASARVVLPATVAPADLETVAFTGGYGATGRAAEIGRTPGGEVVFTTTGELGPREGLTIGVSWPHGLVKFPGPWVKAWRFISNNLVLAVPFLAFGFLWRRWRRQGRDPGGSDSVVVRYEPPEGVSPGGLGTVVDEKVDLADITATVVDLAVRGYLRIEVDKSSTLFGLVEKETTTFHKLHDRPAGGLLEHEQLVYDGIFESGDRVEVEDLRQRFYKRLPEIRKAMYRRMVELGAFPQSPHAVRIRYALYGLLAALVTVLAGFGWIVLTGGVLPHAAIATIVAAVVTMVIFFCFAPAMPRRTKKGVGLAQWARGFEEFVDRVESDKLEADRRRNVFESLLPYAMALGVSATWARQFEGIYEQGQPGWYVGTGLHANTFAALNTGSLEKSLSSTMSDAGQMMSTGPRSQGSSGFGGGGGGFSGGGGGGGGGGSWW